MDRQPKAPPMYWCDECDPYSEGSGKPLTIVRTYTGALQYVADWCKGQAGAFRALIRSMQEAKGLSGRKTADKIVNFFHGEPSETVGPVIPSGGNDDGGTSGTPAPAVAAAPLSQSGLKGRG